MEPHRWHRQPARFVARGPAPNEFCGIFHLKKSAGPPQNSPLPQSAGRPNPPPGLI